MKEIELYIHIPFCVRKCNYCDFLSFPSTEEVQNRYTDALCQEMREAAYYLSLKEGNEHPDAEEEIKVKTVFFGGGTPSILSIYNMDKIMGCLRECFDLTAGAEISLEANPGTLNKEKLAAYRSMGFNRLSIGLQSADDACLKMLGRIHTFDQFLENYDQARKAGFDNINIDIMSALPGQTLASYLETLRIVTDLRPEHISSYSLILEEGTPFYGNEYLRSRLPDEDTERKMYEETGRFLLEKGYRRYEISNYAMEGKECVHNLGYWEGVPYLGLGLGASSYWRKGETVERCSGKTDMEAYLLNPFTPFAARSDHQWLSREDRMEEYMFLGLRKTDGISISGFEKQFGDDLWSVYGHLIKEYADMGLMDQNGDFLFLTERGIDVSNRIFSSFLLDR